MQSQISVENRYLYLLNQLLWLYPPYNFKTSLGGSPCPNAHSSRFLVFGINVIVKYTARLVQLQNYGKYY